MALTEKKLQRFILVWAAVLTSFSLLMSIGNTHSRLIDWTSTELIYIPSETVDYASDCLSQSGKQILLSDWQADEVQRTLEILISRPVTETPEETPSDEPVTEDPNPEENPSEDTPKDDTPSDDTPTEEDPTEENPTEENPTEEDPTEENPTEENPTEEDPTEENPTEENPTEENPTEEDPTEENPTVENPTEEDPTDETPTEEDPIEDPTPENPSTEDPSDDDTDERFPDENQSEVTVTMDEVAALHLNYKARVGEDMILLVLTRVEDAPGLSQTTTLTIHIEWFGLQGTICVDMLPYGDGALENIDIDDHSRVVTGLVPVAVNDTINRENPIACVKLNLQTLADFTLTFNLNGSALNKVLWSMDGENYTLLYDRNQLTIAWPYPEGWDGTLYLDFGDVLQAGQQPTIAVEPTGYSRYEFSPFPQSLPETSDLVLKAAGLPYTLAINPTWGDAAMEIWQIQRLLPDEAGNLAYQPETSLTATVTAGGILLTATQADLYPPSGSYRLIVQWIWNETVVEEQIIYFFVNTN